MAIRDRTQLIDILTTLLLFGIGIAALYTAQGYPGRARMWPTYVMSILLILVCIHLFNLAKEVWRSPEEATETETSESGVLK